MSKVYFVTHLDEDSNEQIGIHYNLTDVKKCVTSYFKANYERITVYEAREMDINIDISISTKKELPF